MKLSAMSRDYVAKQVREAFSDDLRKAEEALRAAEKALADRYSRFDRDLEKAKSSWMADVVKLVNKHGLHWADYTGPEHGGHIDVHAGSSCYSEISRSSFDETSDEAVKRESEAVEKVRSQIEEAVRKALFEIELKGRKDTLNEIVEQVIRETREGK